MQRIYISLFTVVLLLTLVGQAVASVTMSCDMPHMSQPHATMADSSDMHHDMSAGMMNMDCCDDDASANQECGCPMSACSTHSMLNMSVLVTVILTTSEKVQLYIPQNQHRIASSLYRPPMPA
ncbi:hypothetical protein H5200_09065 [Pseudoalteromonas sp. SG43-7]|mgnify:CR=1 FL=1|uniref:CopL family metal-binding regulatory protein n=1 Tax=Pseudoalteromonas rhizosphaerae TaxID=2518973 RepID=A0ABW8KTG5_9GAMM|nr:MULTISPECIES: hypothetical protein [Pseudoalteromonas]MBB1418905.1 hypothetical protein [Pseudoalteromonas sp. SG44-1]MBB1422066.1 hypothetical protein [Pseudoalteromonas sp. SG43-7]MBB1481614.1 hypothetical protein [Pseudoalteromonas sp. SG41-2]